MGKSRRKKCRTILKKQMMWNGKWKSFIDSVSCHDLNTEKTIDGYTLLSCATEFGRKEIVEYLMKYGASSSATNVNGSIPLHIAAQHNHIDLLEIFINLSVFVDSRDNMNCTPLHYASREGWLNTVKWLVETKADINAKTIYGSTPVMFAVKRKNLNVFNYLFKSGADLVGCEEKTTILHYACEAGWIEAVKSIVDIGSDIDAQTQDGETPLLIAAKHADKNVLDILLKSGASLQICGPDSLSLLHYACRNGWIDLLQRLVDAGWDINSKTPDGRTSLMVAAENDHLKLFEYLLEVGADIEAKMIPCEWKSKFDDSLNEHDNRCNDYSIYHCDCFKDDYTDDTYNDYDYTNYDDTDDDEDVLDVEEWTILHYASSIGQVPLVLYLISKGAYVNVKTSKGITPLHLAVEIGNLEVSMHLLKAGADINGKTSNGSTPLYLAIMRNHPEIVAALLKAGADFDAKTSDGTTPLHLAVWSENLEIAAHLLKAGADINGKTSDGTTILCLAIINDVMEIVVHLLKEGANCNEKNDDTAFYTTGTAFECYVEDMYQREEYLSLFFEKGAYITNDTYSSLMECERFKKVILKNVEFCSQAILNKFNNLDLNQMYQVPFAVQNLPLIKRMKLGSDSYLAKCIKDSVVYDIEANGYCNIPKIQPIVLSVLATKAFNNHFKDINV